MSRLASRRKEWVYRSISLAVLVLVLQGCGSGNNGDAQVPSNIAFEDLGDAIVDKWCQGYVECGVYRSFDACTETIPWRYATFSLFSPFSAQQIEGSVADGTIIYDGKKAGECLRTLNGPNCRGDSILFDAPSACDEIFNGTVAMGEPCFEDHECADSLECIGQSFRPCYAGACGAVERAGYGSSCVYRQCEEGMQCSDAKRCISSTELNDSCDGYGSCPLGESCVSETGDCAPLPDTGEPCEFRCLNLRDHCSFDGFCEPRSDVGESCYSFNGCLLHSTCIEDICVPKSGPGEICVNYTGLSGCLIGTNCNEDTGNCEVGRPFSCPSPR